jgi:hypothetical protein
VDEFIARIEATLSGNAQPGHAITAADVQAAMFNVTRHGGHEELTIAGHIKPRPTATGVQPTGKPRRYSRDAH